MGYVALVEIIIAISTLGKIDYTETNAIADLRSFRSYLLETMCTGQINWVFTFGFDSSFERERVLIDLLVTLSSSMIKGVVLLGNMMS